MRYVDPRSTGHFVIPQVISRGGDLIIRELGTQSGD